MFTRIYLNPTNKMGFEYLEYDFSESKARINLCIDQCNSYFAGENNTNRIFFNTISSQETLDPPTNLRSIKDFPTIQYKISGHRKAYRALLKIRQESQYEWEKNEETRFYIDQQIEYLKEVLQQRLPVYQFWSTSSHRCIDQSGIEQKNESTTKVVNDKHQVLFSKSIINDNKKAVIEQLNSIYHRALLGERACLDTISFNGVLRKSLDSLAIDSFRSMASLKIAHQIPSLEKFVSLGLARLDVARLVFKNNDFHFYNYGLGKNKHGEDVLAVIDLGQAAWDLVCRYYGFDANKNNNFTHFQIAFTSRAPTRAVSFSTQDVIKLPFTTHAQFFHAEVNGLFGTKFPSLNLTHLQGIEEHPQYVYEKFYFFLKAILFPKSFHDKVHYGFMPNSKYTYPFIQYRQKNTEYTRGILFQCDDFWLHFADNPEWIEQIQSEFEEFNREMYLYFKADDLMAIKDINRAYEAIIPTCLEKLPGILEKKSEEIKKVLQLYQFFKSDDYQTTLQTLTTVLGEITNYHLRLTGQSNIPSTKIIPIFNKINNLYLELERCDKSHNLPCQYKIYRTIKLFEREQVHLEVQKLFKYVLFNKPDKIKQAIANNTFMDEHIHFKISDSESITATELALAYGHKEVVEELFNFENILRSTRPNDAITHSLENITKEIQEAAMVYFLNHCASKKIKKIGFFILHDVKERMQDIFNLFRCLREPVNTIEQLEQIIHKWANSLKKGSSNRSKLEETVMKVLERHPKELIQTAPSLTNSNTNEN